MNLKEGQVLCSLALPDHEIHLLSQCLALSKGAAVAAAGLNISHLAQCGVTTLLADSESLSELASAPRQSSLKEPETVERVISVNGELEGQVRQRLSAWGKDVQFIP